MLKWKMPEEKVLLEESPRVLAGQLPHSPGWLSPAPLPLTLYACRGRAAALQHVFNFPAARKIQISSTNSERGQKSKQTHDTTASAHQMEAGAGSGCQHQVTARPGVAIWILGNPPCAAHASSLPSYVTLPGMPGTAENQCRHNTHSWGLSRCLSLDSSGSGKL